MLLLIIVVQSYSVDPRGEQARTMMPSGMQEAPTSMSDVVVAREECLALFGIARCRDAHGASRARPNIHDDEPSFLSHLLVCCRQSATMRPSEIRRSDMPGRKFICPTCFD